MEPTKVHSVYLDNNDKAADYCTLVIDLCSGVSFEIQREREKERESLVLSTSIDLFIKTLI